MKLEEMIARVTMSCATCKWWKMPFFVERDPVAFRIQAIGDSRPDWMPCSVLSTAEHEGPSQLVYGEVSDPYYDVRIWTAPEFGCVQWEAKE